MTDKLKQRYFQNGDTWLIAPHMTAEQAEGWRKEYSLCACETCGDHDCPHRLRESRYPSDAGGQDQCLRLMKEKSPFSWRNGGIVISIPQEVVNMIRGQ